MPENAAPRSVQNIMRIACARTVLRRKCGNRQRALDTFVKMLAAQDRDFDRDRVSPMLSA